MTIGALIILLITTLPGILLLVLGAAPELAGDSLIIEADWVRLVFVTVGAVVGLLGVRGLIRAVTNSKDDKEARLKRAPFVATGLAGSGLAMLGVAFAGGAALSGQGAEPVRVIAGLYGAWLVLFGVPAFFARKLDKIAPLPEVDPNQPRPCGRCGTTLAPGTRACHYCGALVS